MAIIFVSPKKKQRAFFWSITILLILFLSIISSIIFYPEIINETPNIPIKTSFDQPDIKINLNIIDSDKVKNLEPFDVIQTQFTYIARNQNGEQIQGNISAATQEDAQKLLEGSGFKVISLKEMDVGRNEPFVPYLP